MTPDEIDWHNKHRVRNRLSALEHPDTLACEDAGRLWVMEEQ